MTVYVLDASAGFDLLLDTAEGRAVETALEPNADWWTAEHYYLEVLSALRHSARSGEIAQARATALADRLADARIDRALLRPLVRRVWAMRHNVTPYDAAYVVLARELDAILVTTDGRLRRAPRLGVRILEY